jgi:hypothetical protein
MRIKSQADFFSGVMFTSVGGAFAIGATTYTVGEGARMGPGYFPLMLGIVLTMLGAFIIFEALVVETEDGDPIGKWAWKPLVFVIGANLAFGILLVGLPSIGIPSMGMIVAIYALTIISSMAGNEFELEGQKRPDPGHRPGHRQLPRLHLAAQAPDPGLAVLHRAEEIKKWN